MNKTIVTIKTDTIELDKFLKLAGAVSTGGIVRELIDNKLIKKNGEIETARRRKLIKGDIVSIDGIGVFEVG